MKILIVEDEYSLADAMSEALQKEGFESKDIILDIRNNIIW